MRSFLPGRGGSGTVLSLAAIVGVGMFSMRLARQQASPTPFELFQKLLPVVRHPRCSNCHGGVDPVSGLGHLPGRIDTNRTHKQTYQPCKDCHSDAKEWFSPGADHFFVGKSDREVCAIFAEFAMKQGHDRFITNHLTEDVQIIAGFEGLMGGARDTTGSSTDKADPPPMKQGPFVKLGKDWIDRGQGACELLGSIVMRESVAASDSFSLGPIETRMNYSGTRAVTLTLRDGKYDADIRTDYTVIQVSKSSLENPKTGEPCYLTYTRNERQLGTTTGVASVAIKDTIFFADTKPPQTDYRIDVLLPPETTQRTESRTTVDGCNTGMPFPPQSETGSFTWGRTRFIIEGHVEDPKTDGRAGSCDRISKSTEINTDKLEWDRSHPCFKFKRMGNSWYLGLMRRTLPTTFHDETPIPYHLHASWNLKYSK